MIGRARYTIEVDGDDVIVLADRGGSLSVTNDVEAVVHYLAELFDLTGRRIVYRDTIGRWDGIAHRRGEFAGFIALGMSNRDDAVHVARNTCPSQWQGRAIR